VGAGIGIAPLAGLEKVDHGVDTQKTEHSGINSGDKGIT
jgi:hypothetical protein